MAADFSRVRSNPLLDYAGVELKQGGVLLDADANELVAILDRRLRALAGDVLGRATVGANTPDAFRITLAGGGLRASVAVACMSTACWPKPRRRRPGRARVRRPDGRDALRRARALRRPALSARRPAAAARRADTSSISTSGTARSRIWSIPTSSKPRLAWKPSSRLQTVWQVRVLAEEVRRRHHLRLAGRRSRRLGGSHRALDRVA